jgi:hypothetical protein
MGQQNELHANFARLSHRSGDATFHRGNRFLPSEQKDAAKAAAEKE